MSKDPQEILSDARAALSAGEGQRAFALLRPLLSFPAAEPTFADGLELFVQVARVLAGEDFANTIEAARSGDAQALYDAGYALYEEGLFDIGAAVLARANERAPGQPLILNELAACLEMEMRFEDAARILEASGLTDRNPQLRYFLGFHRFMAGDASGAAALLPALNAMAGADAGLQFMASALEEMVERHARLSAVTALDHRDLTGWHAALHGGLLLHESPFGHDTPMHGRYAYMSDSYRLMQEGIDALTGVLRSLSIAPPQILHPPERGSEALARALAERLSLPCLSYAEHTDEPGLVAVYDLRRVRSGELITALATHKPGQMLFVHACAWLDPLPFAPDFTTLLYQHISAPWEPQMLGGGERSEADDSPAETLAKRVLSATPDAGAASARPVDDVVRIAQALGEGLSARRKEGRRAHFRKGGPVPSSFFR